MIVGWDGVTSDVQGEVERLLGEVLSSVAVAETERPLKKFDVSSHD